MTSNFEFLMVETDTAILFETANFAEQNYIQKDYEGTLTKVGKMAKKVAFSTAEQENIILPERSTFNDYLSELKQNNIESYILDGFYSIKGIGNKAAHVINSQEATKENALKALNHIFIILVWYVKRYTDTDIQTAYLDFLEPEAEKRYQTAERKLIYIQSGKWSQYDGYEKIGDASIEDFEIDQSPNSKDLQKAADNTVRAYMNRAGVPYTIHWAELAYSKIEKRFFRDYDVHEVLKRSGYSPKEFGQGNEFYPVDVETAKSAIKAVKEGKSALQGIAEAKSEYDITLRPEQDAAVAKTKKSFKKKDKMLWNAKMRFGKTLTALQLVKEEQFQKVLIMTHRPVVSDSWFEDFNKMKMADSGYFFGSYDKGERLEKLKTGNQPFIYFASIQLLRYGNGQANLGQFSDIDWDLIIVDEAHEGTQTALAEEVLKTLKKDKTKTLELSGTPFNLLDQYEESQVYTWDYTMEQTAKLKWSLESPDKPNPYEGLPKVSMFTFDMRHKEHYADESKAFNFREFFSVDDNGDLVHFNDVTAFLDNLTNPDKLSNYPFSTPEYREELRHTLWLLPGVKEAAAFEKCLKAHRIFGQEYDIINVVKDGDDEVASQNDLDKVRNAITKDPSQTKTITLTVRKLTTGVNIPEWTAVFFLSNTTSAMNYLQAAFRAQTPFSHEKLGMKKNCYIFDFAPDRALSVMAESAQINSDVGKKNTQEQKDAMTRLLNFMPILGSSDTGMKTFNVDSMLTQLKKVYAEKAVRSGFEDDSLYNDKLLTLTVGDAEMFKNLSTIVGKTQGQKKVSDIVIADNGLTDEEYDKGEKAKQKPIRKRTKEEKELIEKINAAKKQRKTMISILRGVSIRIPMMIYGMQVELSKDITIADFTKQVDDKSWQEFMPKGFTKGMFKDISQYYDAEVFIEAGRLIRQRAKSYDKLDFIERAERIAELFSSFKNPDKETVLTPWRVVNLQLVKTIGGLNFYDDDFVSTTGNAISSLHWVDKDDTKVVYTPVSKILEINTKTGLYPLHAAMSLYYQVLNANDDSHFDADKVYRKILKENIYAIAKTPMAKTITERTLAGYRDFEMNVECIEDFVETIKKSPEKGKEKVEKVFDNMKFDVVIGNPPYQENQANNNKGEALYHYFYDVAEKIADKYCLITPARFLFNGGLTPKPWNQKMLNDKHLKVKYFAQNSSEIFPNTDIKGGVAVLYRDSKKDFGAIKTFVPDPILNGLSRKFEDNLDKNLPSIIFGGRSDLKFNDEFLKDYPETVRMRLAQIQIKYPDVTTLSANEEYELKSSTFESLDAVFLKEEPADKDNYYKILGLYQSKRVYRWIQKKYMAPRYEKSNNIEKYKVFVPKANGSGAIGEVLSAPLIGAPLTSATPTFISIGAFDTELEAENLLSYVKTKFARSLLGILKITQDNPPFKWAHVPLQDFTANSDVPWEKSIAEIDQFFYQKYGLDDHEITFIETKVKEML
ncbi:restriction endonuclease [Lactococcus hodotermopsidis]|uniref:Restriction endonuclease n=1 Tax=Pseudolactococcus hodotermopsidis TaxID=2709157 RepID=A0A6A0BAZ7_9LACT|nr:Eco57I restriction-modification methylase domain-containing protein [Lactococcus hodotermopsidis]GFH41631.1 restriction endonuclease [Lactococcus hodotermopsidis]